MHVASSLRCLYLRRSGAGENNDAASHGSPPKKGLRWIDYALGERPCPCLVGGSCLVAFWPWAASDSWLL